MTGRRVLHLVRNADRLPAIGPDDVALSLEGDRGFRVLAAPEGGPAGEVDAGELVELILSHAVVLTW